MFGAVDFTRTYRRLLHSDAVFDRKIGNCARAEVSPKEYLRRLEVDHVTYSSIVPTMLRMIFDEAPEWRPLKTLKSAFSRRGSDFRKAESGGRGKRHPDYSDVRDDRDGKQCRDNTVCGTLSTHFRKRKNQ